MAIALDTHVRSKGIGSLAADALLRHLAARGAEVLTFSTGIENAAMRRLMRGVTFLEVRTNPRDGYPDTKLVGVLLLSKK
jgi:RimJ/RimL family protein N-acetyltransferase